MSQIGRIGGQALTDNLLRAGVNLAFETDLLYLDVINGKVGIKTSSPVYDLDVNSNIRTTDLTIDSQGFLDNLKFIAPNTISTITGGIGVYINGGGQIWHDRMITANLLFDGNLISSFSNSNIVFDPNGSGKVELLTNTNITGDLLVTGNIGMNGDLTGLGTLTLGDTIYDTVTVNTDFTQSIIPGDDILYDFGKSNKRWSQIHATDWTGINNGPWPGSGLISPEIYISDQLHFNGYTAKISGVQSNEDVLINPDTGITYIEKTKWELNDITNLNNTAITLASTGIGYIKIDGTNGFVIPFGDTSQRRLTPEVGETRWNSNLQYLECWTGTEWAISTGGGEEVTVPYMDDLGNVWSLILG